MKRWAWITIGLYVAVLLVLAWPLTWLAFIGDHERSLYTLARAAALPVPWVCLGVILLAQLLLLWVPVGTAERRPRARRKLWVPVIVSALLMGVLAGTSVVMLVMAGWGDQDDSSPFRADDGPGPLVVLAGGIMIANWLFWALVFNRFRKSTDPDALTSRLMRWLLAGSILELLIAVPSHIIVRARGDCCAPFGTFVGIATGVSVTLLAFGPGVFFLLVKRMSRLRYRRENRLCLKCGYDLRASTQRCPECGTPIESGSPSAPPPSL